VTAASLAPERPDTPPVEAVRRRVEDHLDVATTMASRYRNRGIELEDLEQVALLGLTKAAHRFDPGLGHDFMSFAVPTIRGELRRHFRDHGWTVRPPRRLQELQARVIQATEELRASLGRSPRPTEIIFLQPRQTKWACSWPVAEW
jgi:RNA polymerase sigma-B factor